MNLYIMNVEIFYSSTAWQSSLGKSQGGQGQHLCPTLFTLATMQNTDNTGTLASLQSGIFAVQSQKFNKFIFICISEEENVYETYNFSTHEEKNYKNVIFYESSLHYECWKILFQHCLVEVLSAQVKATRAKVCVLHYLLQP